jgi:hypothetical protein
MNPERRLKDLSQLQNISFPAYLIFIPNNSLFDREKDPYDDHRDIWYYYSRPAIDCYLFSSKEEWEQEAKKLQIEMPNRFTTLVISGQIKTQTTIQFQFSEHK